MNLRSQLAFSHLKLLMAFVVIHIMLFVVAVKYGNRSHLLDEVHTQELESLANSARNFPELKTELKKFADEKKLTVILENGQGRREAFGGNGRRRGPPQARQVLWHGEDGELATLRLRRRGGPPTDPLVHVMVSTILASIFGVFLAFRYSRTISRPLGELIEATERLESGADEKVTLAHLEGPKEVRDLARSFAHMSETLSTNLKNLKEERDRAEASEKSRRQLIADVSHNLRTPLAAAVGWLDSLIDGHVEDQKSCLRQIKRETLWASQRLERMLRLSRWEHSEPMMTLRAVSLSDIVLEVAENLEDRAAEVGLSLELDIEPGLSVRGDRHNLRDLIQILLENVIEHSGQDGQAFVEGVREGSQVVIRVKDDGPGFPEEYLEHWHGEPVVAKTGRVSLGLAIARRLALAHGSDLVLSNRQNQSGSVASFRLPAVVL